MGFKYSFFRENVSWASTCNSVGQTAGWFIGNVVFLVLESQDFSNKYIRPYLGLPAQDYGILTLHSMIFVLKTFFFHKTLSSKLFLLLAAFMHILGFVFIITTTLVMIFKKEITNDDEQHPSEAVEDDDHKHHIKNYEDKLTIKSTYMLMWKLLSIVPVRKIIVIQLTMKVKAS